jgi:hypothetical protein
MIWLSWHPDEVNGAGACSYYPAASEEEEAEEDAAATGTGSWRRPASR